MSNNERPSAMRRFFNNLRPKSRSKSRASSTSRNSDVQDSSANPTNAPTTSAPLSRSVSPSSITSPHTGKNIAPTSASSTLLMIGSNPARAIAAPRSILSNTTEHEDGLTTLDVVTSTPKQPLSPKVQPEGKLPLDAPPAHTGSDSSDLEHSVIPTGIAAEASTSTARPAQDPIGNSSTKEFLRMTWHGIEYLLQNAGKFLDGTPFKAPITAINIVIELGNTVIDNKDALQELIIRTTERLKTVNSELMKDKDAASKETIERFVSKLITEFIELEKISKQGMWKKVLDNQENKKKIEDTFKKIDEHMKDLQLHLIIRVDRNVRELNDVLTRVELERWPRSLKATYYANLGESTTLVREACTQGTRTAILADIYQWASDPDAPSIFWLTGEAGSGKSTLAYTVAKHFDDDGNILGGNFFCSRQLEETRTERYIIPTIVYQLARKSGSFARALLKADRHDTIDRELSWQMKELLVNPWQKSADKRGSDFPSYLIIVDALDEINGVGGSAFLEELLKTTNADHLPRLKFLVTSRPDPNIANLCKSFTSETVCRLYDVPSATVKADITTYLRAKLPALKDHEDLAKLADKADGLFIYAATVVRHITPRSNMAKSEQLRLMTGLLLDHISPMHGGAGTPSLIDGLYQQILWAAFSELNGDLLPTRLKILHTILCTQERISTSVAAALHSDTDDLRDVADVVVQDLHAVLYVKDDCVFWYHASFPDFIFTPTRSKFTFYTSPSSAAGHVVDMSCDKAAHHGLLTRSCFDVMMSPSGLRFNICQLPSSFLLDSQVPDLGLRIEENISDVLRYCSYYWAQHLAQTISAEASGLFARIEGFLTERVLFWIEIMNLLRSNGQCAPILLQARKRVLECTSGHSNLSLDLADVANFTTYFTGSPAALSTPHLYISSLATWSKDSAMWQQWRRQFALLPSFRRIEGEGVHTVPLMTIPTGSSVACVAFSGDGTRIVSGSRDNSVRVWDALSGRELKMLSGHTSSVWSVAFSGDGTRIVSGSSDNSVRVWDVLSGRELKMLSGHTDSVESVAFSGDGTRIVSGSLDNSVRVWDALSGRELKMLSGHTSSVWSVAFSGDGTRIVSGSWDNSVRVWDALSGRELMKLSGHTSGVRSVAFSGDGTRIVSGSWDNSVRVWDVLSGRELKMLSGHTSSVWSVAFSGDGTRIVSGSRDNSVRVWDALSGRDLKKLSGHTDSVLSVAFSGDGTRIVSGSRDNSVRVWDALSGRELKMLSGHTDSVLSVAFSGDGTRIVSGSSDNSVRVWDALSGRELKKLSGHTSSVSSVAFSGDGTRIVSGSWDNSVRVWDALSGRELKMLSGHTDSVRSVAFSGDGTRIVSGSRDNSVRVWDALSGRELKMLSGHTSSVWSVAFSGDGTRIVSGSSDNSVRVWDVLSGRELKMLSGHTDSVLSVAFSGDGTRIVSGSSDNSVRVWDVLSGRELKKLSGHTSSVWSIAFSGDGTRIVSGSRDNSVRVWDALSGRELKMLSGHTSSVWSVAFSGDGTRIVSGSSDNSVRVWAPAQDDGLHWTSNEINWIVSNPAKDPLLWLPKDVHRGLNHSYNSLTISREGHARVDFRCCKIGPDWADCYTP